MGNTVTFDKITSAKTRLFGSREPQTIKVPEKVTKEFGVVSIVATPMEHTVAEFRTRLKARIEAEKAKANHDAGIMPSDHYLYIQDHLRITEISDRLNALVPSMPELPEQTPENEAEILKIISESKADVKKVKGSKEYKNILSEYETEALAHMKKWDVLISKSKMRNNEVWMELESELMQNTADVVYKNCSKVIFEDNSEVEIGESTGKMIHKDFVWWIISEIENISYLNENEFTAFM